jgi:hypothetical protein
LGWAVQPPVMEPFTQFFSFPSVFPVTDGMSCAQSDKKDFSPPWPIGAGRFYKCLLTSWSAGELIHFIYFCNLENFLFVNLSLFPTQCPAMIW